MLLKEKILNDLKHIDNPNMLQLLFDYIQQLKNGLSNTHEKTKSEILSLQGSISKEDADEMSKIIDSEFNRIEGVW